MRLWSIHPRYLDARGLTALWREALLAQKVLLGKTTGYRNHPQLSRFRDTPDPAGAIAQYLVHVADEADARGFRFDRTKITDRSFNGGISVTTGQICYEFQHLLGKLNERSHELYERLRILDSTELHPMMYERPGKIEDWEKIESKQK